MVAPCIMFIISLPVIDDCDAVVHSMFYLVLYENESSTITDVSSLHIREMARCPTLVVSRITVIIVQ